MKSALNIAMGICYGIYLYIMKGDCRKQVPAHPTTEQQVEALDEDTIAALYLEEQPALVIPKALTEMTLKELQAEYELTRHNYVGLRKPCTKAQYIDTLSGRGVALKKAGRKAKGNK